MINIDTIYDKGVSGSKELEQELKIKLIENGLLTEKQAKKKDYIGRIFGARIRKEKGDIYYWASKRDGINRIDKLLSYFEGMKSFYLFKYPYNKAHRALPLSEIYLFSAEPSLTGNRDFLQSIINYGPDPRYCQGFEEPILPGDLLYEKHKYLVGITKILDKPCLFEDLVFIRYFKEQTGENITHLPDPRSFTTALQGYFSYYIISDMNLESIIALTDWGYEDLLFIEYTLNSHRKID